jgi:hypothetical protein
MLPGTMRELVIPTLEANSGKRAGKHCAGFGRRVLAAGTPQRP